MPSQEKNFSDEIQLLKKCRLLFLKLHKDLIDVEKQIYERENGRVSPGHFLQILLSDQRFSWLRIFSGLIVEIDEMFDLDDGYSLEMVEKHLSRLKDLVDFQAADDDFNVKFKKSIESDSPARTKYIELRNLLMKN